MQGCEKLVEITPSMADCPSLKTLTLWGTIVLVNIPDLTPLVNLQIDGVPEQLADWEAQQKQKRLDDARDGKTKGGPASAADLADSYVVLPADKRRAAPLNGFGCGACSLRSRARAFRRVSSYRFSNWLSHRESRRRSRAPQDERDLRTLLSSVTVALLLE